METGLSNIKDFESKMKEAMRKIETTNKAVERTIYDLNHSYYFGGNSEALTAIKRQYRSK